MDLDESNIDILTKELNKVVQIDALILETKNSMKPLKERLKQLQFERKELEKQLCPTMERNDLRKAILPDDIATIEYKTRQSVVPITQKTVKEKMVLFFEEGPGSLISFNSKRSHEKGNEIFEYIYGKQNRQFVRKDELKTKDIKL